MTDPSPILRSDLLAAGTTVDEIRHALRSGRLRPLARGVYSETDSDDPVARHRALVLAHHARSDGDFVFSHVSAAVLHGLTLWDVDLSRVHVGRDARAGGRRSRHLHVHVTAFGADEITVVDGLPVTSIARTVVDLARSLPADQAVVAGDSAVRMHPGATTSLPGVLASSATRNGIAGARRVVGLLDGRSESPGESLSRLRIRTAGLPAPTLQHELRTRSGVFVARPDFLWESAGVVGEFDGMGKYGADEPGATAEIVRREKLREDAIRDLGFEVVRWTWPELFRFDVVRDRLDRAASRARR